MANEPSEKQIAVKSATKAVLIITNTLSIIIPLVCFTIVPLFKSEWTLFITTQNSSKELNKPFLIFLIVSFIVSVAFIVLNCYLSTKDYIILTQKGYSDLTKAKADKELYQEMIDKFNKLCDNKLENLRNEIDNVLYKRGKPHKGEVFPDPKTQMIYIFKTQMCDFLASFTGFKNKDNQNLFVSVAYKINDGTSGEWAWFEGCDPESDCSAQDLVNNPKSAFYHLLKDNDRFIFYNSKKEASNKGLYIYNTTIESDNKDLENDGSLIGRRITIGQSYRNPCAELVIFFSTKDVLLLNCRSNSKEMREMRMKIKE